MKGIIIVFIIISFITPSFGMNTIYKTNELNENRHFLLKINDFKIGYIFLSPHKIAPFYKSVCILPFNATINNITILEHGKNRFSVDGMVTIFIKNKIMRINCKIRERWSYRIEKGIYDGKHVTIVVMDVFPELKNGYAYLPEKIDARIYYTLSSNKFNDTYDLLIIAPDSWLNALQPLVNEKEQHGIKTILMSIEDILSQYNGRDNAEKVKYCIKDATEQYGIKYVLLVGDVNKIPVRYSNLNMSGEPFISDLYYADIYDANGSFSSWDSNSNGIYGEGTDSKIIDSVDLYPDVYVGRLACRNVMEVKTMVNKIVEYENASKPKPWFKNLVLVGGDTHPWWKDLMFHVIGSRISFEGEQTCDRIANYMDGFNPIKLYAKNFNNKLTDENIIKKIDDGAGFVVFSGHGLPGSWATHPPWRIYKWVPEQGFTMDDIKKLNKGDEAIYVFDACLCGKIDEECIAWDIVKEAGIASMALTTFGVLIPGSQCDESMNGYMTTHIFKNYDNATYLGEMFYDAIIDYLNNIPYMLGSIPINYFVAEEWILLADPSLMIKCLS